MSNQKRPVTNLHRQNAPLSCFYCVTQIPPFHDADIWCTYSKRDNYYLYHVFQPWSMSSKNCQHIFLIDKRRCAIVPSTQCTTVGSSQRQGFSSEQQILHVPWECSTPVACSNQTQYRKHRHQWREILKHGIKRHYLQILLKNHQFTADDQISRAARYNGHADSAIIPSFNNQPNDVYLAISALLLACSAMNPSSLLPLPLAAGSSLDSGGCSPCKVRWARAHWASRASFPKSFWVVNAVCDRSMNKS